MVLGWIGALFIGISLGLMGSGGSILTVPVLVYLFGQEEKVAIAGSLAIVGTIALAGGLAYLKNNLVKWKTVVLLGLPSMFATYLGALVAATIPGIVQLVVFAFIMLTAALSMFNKQTISDTSHAPQTQKVILSGLFVGVITGIVGVGGGFLIVPALVIMAGLPMRNAIATSLFVIAINSYTGFIKYYFVLKQSNTPLDWTVILSVAGIGVIGTFVGKFICHKVPQKELKRYFAYFLLIMAAFILYKEIPKVLNLIN
jgi:uncharacterized membrane protein YfcA